MSLRAKLTFIYTSFFAILIILSSGVVYARVSELLMNEVDVKLHSAASNVSQILSIDENLNIGPLSEIKLGLDRSVVVQVRNMFGLLVGSTGTGDWNIGNQALDFESLNVISARFKDVYHNESMHIRVYSVPLFSSQERIGVMQVATDLTGVDETLRLVVQGLTIAIALSITLSGVIGWIIARRALNPLAIVTKTASEITRADDLSRRIPHTKAKDDEVGLLIQAFNQTMERLEDLFYAQRTFLADVSHELRTPLTVIKGNANLMRKMGKMDEESINSIETEVDRLSRMVGDLMLVAQAESGRLPLENIPVALDTLLLEVYQYAIVLAQGEKSVVIDKLDQVHVCGDADRLKQVILNLVSNAIKYTQKNGEVLIQLGKKDGMAYLSVKDNGIGISPKNIDRIFNRFYRTEKSRSRKGDDKKGFGLGLSIAFWIIKNHQGRIDVESNEGEGSIFTIWIPLISEDCQTFAKELSPASASDELARTT